MDAEQITALTNTFEFINHLKSKSGRQIRKKKINKILKLMVTFLLQKKKYKQLCKWLQ